MVRLLTIIALVAGSLPAMALEATAPADSSSRLSVLVLPFETRGAGSDKASMADDYLMEELAVQKRFIVVEREKLEKVMLERKLPRKNLTAKDGTRVGKLLSADQVLYGRVEEVKGETLISLRMVATTTSASREYSVSATTGTIREFRRLVSDAVARVAQDFPLLEGRITGRAGSGYRTDLTGSGLRAGMDVIVFRRGDEVLHPTTGRSLGRKVKTVAAGVVNSVEGKSAIVMIAKSEKGQRIQVGDLVITK